MNWHSAEPSKTRPSGRAIDHVFATHPLRTIERLEAAGKVINLTDCKLSDHYPVLVEMASLLTPLPASRIVNRKAYLDYLNHAIDSGASAVEELNVSIKSRIRSGVKPLRKADPYRKFSREPDIDRLIATTTNGYEQEYLESFRNVIVEVAAKRFTPEAARTFELLAKLTKYRNFERRDGAIVTEATLGSRLLQGEEL